MWSMRAHASRGSPQARCSRNTRCACPQTCRTLQGQSIRDGLAHGQRIRLENRYDYSDNALAAFRTWCEAKYGTVDALNEAWGTAFWSQHVNSFDEVLLPRHMGGDSMVNPPSSWITSGSATTCCSTSTRPNATPSKKLPRQAVHHELHGLHRPMHMDYAQWANEVDFVSTITTSMRANPIWTNSPARTRSWTARARQAVVRDGALHLRRPMEAA